MTFAIKHIFLASLLAGLGLTASAQMPSAGMDGEYVGGMMQHGHYDAAKMQARMDKHAAVMKQKLKLTADQDGAWNTFTAAMKPPANMPDVKAMRADMDKLSTPERIDKMKTLRAQRDVEMDKRAEAVKTFYAVLSPEQKKVFDAEHTMQGRRHGGERGMHGGAGAAKAQSPMMSKP